MDRNLCFAALKGRGKPSLSARRAWIEIGVMEFGPGDVFVALRKESVDRNSLGAKADSATQWSLSARRAWIEIKTRSQPGKPRAVALRKESVDRNTNKIESSCAANCRSPQGERG